MASGLPHPCSALNVHTQSRQDLVPWMRVLHSHAAPRIATRHCPPLRPHPRKASTLLSLKPPSCIRRSVTLTLRDSQQVTHHPRSRCTRHSKTKPRKTLPFPLPTTLLKATTTTAMSQHQKIHRFRSNLPPHSTCEPTALRRSQRSAVSSPPFAACLRFLLMPCRSGRRTCSHSRSNRSRKKASNRQYPSPESTRMSSWAHLLPFQLRTRTQIVAPPVKTRSLSYRL